MMAREERGMQMQIKVQINPLMQFFRLIYIPNTNVTSLFRVTLRYSDIFDKFFDKINTR